MSELGPAQNTEICVQTRQSTDGNLDVFAKELVEIEEIVILQVDELARKMPEIYNGYAKAIREVSSAVTEILNKTSYDRYSGKVAVAAELLARTTEAFGVYKAAKQHNEFLDRILATKRMYAGNNLLKIKDAFSKAQSKQRQIQKLFSAACVQKYNLSSFDGNKAERVSLLALRTLILYRQSLFITDLSEYLIKEYDAWLSGKQTSNLSKPDYLSVNKKIAKSLFGDDLFDAINKAADENASLTGAQVMLLSDSQLSVLALSDNLCEFKLEAANPAVRKMLELNKGVEQYTTCTEEFRNHIRGGADVPIWIFLFTCGVCVELANWICFDLTKWGENVFWGIVVAIVCVSIRIFIKLRRKEFRDYAENGLKMAADVDEKLSIHCGAVYTEEIDYEKKNAIGKAISSFLN